MSVDLAPPRARPAPRRRRARHRSGRATATRVGARSRGRVSIRIWVPGAGTTLVGVRRAVGRGGGLPERATSPAAGSRVQALASTGGTR